MPPSETNPYAQNYVSQEQIDTLLKGSDDYAFPEGEDPLGDIADFINTDEIDRLLGDDDPEDGETPDFSREDEMSDELLPEDEALEDEELSMISMDDIQRVLSEDGGARDDSEEPPLEDLNLGLDEAGAEGEGELISQDDIDRLLKNSGVEDGEGGEESDDGFQISQEEIETLLTDTSEESPETRDEEISRHASPAPLEDEGEDELPPENSRFKKKLLMVAAGFLLLFAGGGAAGWFFLMGGGDEAPAVADFSDAGDVAGVEGVPASGEPEVVSRLENFLIPAPDGSDYAFVSMHVVLTIRGVKRDPLKGYETFYRKRIYEDMAAKIASLSGERPMERDLRELVRKTAGTILTEGVIDGVVLEDYRLM